jgi:hypothetical protein
VSVPADVEATLYSILKSHDRIGFGRRGVLDAEQEILRFAARLADDDHTRLRRIVLSWIEVDEAERVTTSLHYNLPEHLQALALHLCGSVPIPEALPLLRRLQAEAAFETDDEHLCWKALHESVTRLAAR